MLLLLPTCVFVFWSSLDYVANSWSVTEASREAGGLPGLFLLKTAIPLTALLLAAQGVAEALRSILNLRADAVEPPAMNRSGSEL